MQAKSIKLFAEINFKKIIIVTNDFFSKNELKDLDRSYNLIFEGKIEFEIVQGEELIYENYLSDISGWRAQQILKLKVNQKIETSYYLTLDAKNHLIRKLYVRDLFQNGRPISHVKKCAGSYWEKHIFDTKVLLDFSQYLYLDYFMLPATPYMLISEEVENLSDLLLSKKSSVVDAISNRDATEYLLYYIYLSDKNRARKLYEFKDISESNTVTFFTKGPSSEKILRERLELLKTEEIKWLGVHRNRFFLDYEVDIKESIIDTWKSSGLIETVESGENFWDDFKSSLL